MSDKFDPYREALVVESETVWPQGFHNLDPVSKQRLAEALHADPAAAAELSYVRLYTGFCRRITVTEDDLQRLRSASSEGAPT